MLADSYEITSPYNYAFNNPLLFVDPTGKDNIIYLIVVGSMGKEEVNKILQQANAMLKELKLETRVQLYEGDDFDENNLDRTDNWAVIGNDKKEIAAKVSEITDSNFSSMANNWAEENDPTNPGISYGQIGGKGIAIDNSEGNIGTHQTNSNPDSEGGTALSILHEAGHSSEVLRKTYAGRNYKPKEGDDDGHTGKGVMMNASGQIKSFREVGVSGIINKQDNATYIRAMKARYGTREAMDNYKINKYQQQTMKRLRGGQ